MHPGENGQTTQTQTLLKDLYGDTNVIPSQRDIDNHGQVTDSWRITSSNSSDLTTAIKVLEGVRRVEKDDSPDTHAVRRDIGTTYVAMANTSFDWHKTEEFLNFKVQNDIMFFPIKDWDDDSQVVGWYHLALDADAKAAVEQYEGIQSVSVTTKTKEFRAIPAIDQPQYLQNIPETHQRSNELGADLNKLTDFVHFLEPGKDTFVYVVDRGVRTHAANPRFEHEFHPPDDNPENIIVLQTDLSSFLKQPKHEDNSPTMFHGTFVASKAVGTQYGLAKQATLISVKLTDEELDFVNAFNKIQADLDAHPARQDMSVVLIARGSEEPDTYENVKGNPQWQRNYERPMQKLLAMGVPIVLAAGNEAKTPNRQHIDSRPQIYQSEDMPLINVGAANYEGERISMSQFGPRLTVYAPGEKVTGLYRTDFASITLTGTSAAAPQVAGLIATYLSHEPTRQRWNGIHGVARVKAIRDYIVSDSSSWIRKPGSDIRMIWNGAGEQDHKNAGANGVLNGNPSTPHPTQPPPAPKKTKALSIILQNIITEIDNTNNWLFRLTDQGKSALCRNDKNNEPVLTTPAGGDPSMVDSPPWPGGSYPLKIDGMNCEYKNDGQNAGALWCKEKNGQAISCYADDMMAKKGDKTCDFGVYEHAVVYCEW